MRKIIVLIIFVLVAFAVGVKAQSTWSHPWLGATHSYMASVTDPENDNPVRWYVTTDAAGTIRADYSTVYSFVSEGYNASTKQLEDIALYIVEIEWGTVAGNYYLFFEVEDRDTECTNRMALPIQIVSDFNALVVDNVADPSCPDDVVNPLWNGINQTDIGNSRLVFHIERQNSMLDWQFEFEISEQSAKSFSIDSIRFENEVEDQIMILNQAADLKKGEVNVDGNNDWVLAKIYIRNQMGVTLDFDFNLLTDNDLTRDAVGNTDSNPNDNYADHSIWSLPVITNFSGN